MTDTAQASADTAAVPVVREFEHLILPVPGVWTIEVPHSCLSFECRHMMLTPLRGWFASFSGEVHVAEKPEESSAEVTIDADSLQMPNPAAMDAIKGENFLEVGKFPTLSFKSTHVRHVEAGRWHVAGDLTIKDRTREVTLDTSFEGAVPSPPMFGGRAKMAFVARTEFDRRNFGLDWNVPLPGGGWLVGNRVELTLGVMAHLP